MGLICLWNPGLGTAVGTYTRLPTLTHMWREASPLPLLASVPNTCELTWWDQVNSSVLPHSKMVSQGLAGLWLVVPLSQALPSRQCYDNFLPCYYKCWLLFSQQRSPTTVFCSERKPALSVVITVITTTISPCPPHCIDHWAPGVISDIIGNKLPARQTAKDPQIKRFLRVALTS